MIPSGKAPGGRWGADRAIGEEEARLLDLLSQATRAVAQPEGRGAREHRDRLPSRLYGRQMSRLVDPQGEP